MKINYGCGSRIIPGYYNIDAVHHKDAPRKPDLIYAAEFDEEGKLIYPLPLDDNCADEILAIHVFEHFYRWQVDSILQEWHRLLKTGGSLILELPDLIKCCTNIINGLDGQTKVGKHPDQLGRWGLYGDPRLKDHYMCHKWGYAPKELMRILKENGFIDIKHMDTQFHPAGRKFRDMRIEARKQ